ncbi:O-antigen ligase family protein [Actinoplanes hulinensis]|uniref:O-antigen ligase family protein n=1 Tax=Actinoplanes hulinensis TaxID=1144547 RepID=A0ABS7BCV0_9ACTN|nr:O-antigen ligase family protein [Actinoplanes hulinensis]MBW6438825.1 O-antigen ligase family protein [Actinoplanes hulinensis]
MTAPDTPRPGLVVLLAFVVTLAGHFTLTRAGLNIPILNDVRVPLFLILLLGLVLEAHRVGPCPAEGGHALLGILLLFGYQGLSVLWVPPGSVTGPGLGDLCAITGLLVVYFNLAAWDRDRVTEMTFKMFYVAAWIYFLAGAAGLGRDVTGRWAAFGGGPNVFIRLMIMGVFTSFYLYLRSGDKLTWLAPIPVFLFGAVASGSRGGLISFAITVAVALLAIRPRFNIDRIAKPLALMVAMTAILVVTAGPSIADFVRTRFLEGTVEQGYTSDRDVLYQMALQIFWQRPLLGTGMNGFHTIADLGSGESYVHNLPLSIAAEGGFVGLTLLALAWLGLWHAYTAVPRSERSLESRFAAYCGIFMGATSLFSGDYYDARLMWIFLLLAVVRPARAPAPLPR